MSFSIRSIINSAKSANEDGLAQPQREAIVDLLNYCMYADNFVALAESKVVNDAGSTLSWDPNISFETYEGGSIGKARRAKEDKGYRETFRASIKQRLNTKHSRELAFELCKTLFLSDSNMAAGEADELAALRSLLEVN